jgi:hypothetical protein
MNEADRKKLIAEILSIPTNFELSLADEGRHWFIDRLIRSLETGSPPTPDADIPTRVRTIVAATKTIAIAKSPIKLKIPIETSHKGWHGTTFPRRIEIIYGAIATDPSLAESANEKQLDLVIRRRYRCVARMDLWVNSGSDPPLFQYPDETCEDYRINQATLASWNAATPHRSSTGETLPRWTLRIAGAAPLVPAVDKLWAFPTAQCEGNVLECATALSIVLIDSLLETRDPEAFLRGLNSRGPTHLAICNPTLNDAIPNFVLDRDARQVFTSVHGSMDDLQVGDYVYVWNHPLYPVFQPAGVWSGEHAVVVSCGNRDQRTGFKVSGHGVLPMTIAELHANLLKTLQTFLDAMYVVGVQFLTFLDAALSVSDVLFQQRQVMVGGRLRDTHFYLFNRSVTYTNYTLDPVTSNSWPRFLIVYVPELQEFGFHRSPVMADALADPHNVIPFDLYRSVPPAEQFDPVNWGIRYPDPITGEDLVWPLFRRDNGVLSANLLRERDMPVPPLAREVGATGVRMVQPTHRPTPAGAL